ncbi:hypothetical protein HPB47_018194 [Ixodes persulcatus]|uniref:Uncharacterized protein n=1 Tax=Ixodes persulcatus TaxID=34615 RepID=A0AC60QPV6_IXOPE|nr:hypothetical protein HPB47_018194 [Ixodes persulcatus]
MQRFRPTRKKCKRMYMAPMPPAREDKAVGTDPRQGKKFVDVRIPLGSNDDRHKAQVLESLPERSVEVFSILLCSSPHQLVEELLNQFHTTKCMRESGVVEGADCECAAGKSGACNHSLALLKLLALLRAKDYEEVPPAVACTELPQQWHRPRGEAVASTSLQSVDWRSVREDGLETPITSKLYDAQRNAIHFSDRMASIQTLGESLYSSQASPFAKRLQRATAADPVKTKFGLAPVGSVLSYQQALVPFGYETFISPEVGQVQERNRALPCEPTFFDACINWKMSGLSLPMEQDLLLRYHIFLHIAVF